MKKLLFTVFGGLGLAVVAFTGAAQAQCFWTGLGYSCAAPPAVYWGAPYAAWSAWDFRDYRYKPTWLPSYPGPRPSSGTGQ